MQLSSRALDRDTILRNYNDETWFHAADRWHSYTKRVLSHFLEQHSGKWPDEIVAFIGSGGTTSGARVGRPVHVDLAIARLRGVRHSVSGDATDLPLKTNAIGVTVCVGSVINYCDAAAAIAELGRVTRSDGLLLLEFESSRTFEFLQTPTFNAAATIVDTFYNGRPERIWVYSPTYIHSLLRVAGFTAVEKLPIHILSPLALRFFDDGDRAASFAFCDPFLRRVPGLRGFACNLLFVCVKDGRSK